MKKTHLFFSILMVAVLCLAGTSWAGEASVFDGVQKIIIRAYTTATGAGATGAPTYSAYLEVRDSEGVLVPANKLVVTPLSPAGNPITAEADGTYKIHNNNLISPDFSISFDNDDGITYLICTDENNGLHVMKYSIVIPVPLTCGSANNVPSVTAPTTGLCNSAGTSTGATRSNWTWNWTCHAISGATVPCQALVKENGACGSANNVPSATAPTTGLCNSSAASSGATSGNGTWNWTCPGTNGGSTASCSANIQTSSTADLAISSFRSSAAGSNNLSFSATVTVANLGTGSAGHFKVKIYMAMGTTPTGGQLLVNGTQTVSGLGAGSSVNLTFSNLTFNGLALHTYYHIIAVVDADSEVVESNEGNNIKSRDFEVL
jgi:CARDB